MSRKVMLLLLVILQLSALTLSASTNCCNGKSNLEVELVNDCSNCNTDCDCAIENCSECQGFEKCCQKCCERCDCVNVNCNSCSTQSNQCCSSCCNTKCRGSRSSCLAKQCSQCTCESCGVKSAQQQSSCCNSCCKQKEKIEDRPAPGTNISQITTLPNITIIINHAPIYVNNTPVINTENRCGNASVLSNGTHIVYVYPQNSTCSNRTCCTRQVQQPCRPRLFMPPACPPPMNVPDCSSRCFLPPSPPPPPPPQAPCQYFQTWPYVHCPQTGCYGFGCSPPVPMMPPPPPMMGCIPVPTWPFMRCIPGVGSESVVSYGPPSYQVMGPGGSSGVVPFSSTDHGAAYPPAGVPIGPSPPGYGMSAGP